MKFSLRQLIYLVAFAAILCGVVCFSLDRVRDAKRAAQDERVKAEQAWANSFMAKVQEKANLALNDRKKRLVESPVFKSELVHGKPIVETYIATVVAITDGDTIKVLNDANEQVKVRLESIDCPESKQPFGNKAKQAVGDLFFGKMAIIQTTGMDRFGRTLAFVIVDGVNVSEEMIRRGYAWNYVEYSKSAELAQLEAEAREAKRGLWQDSDPIAPWQWRKKK